MFPVLLLNIFRNLAPYLAVALLAAGVWWHGYQSAEHKAIERESRIAAESNLLIARAKHRNADITAQAAESARIIGDTYDTNHKTISDLTAANRDLLARLRQQSAARCSAGGMPDAAAPTQSGNAADPGTRGFFESAVDSASIADEVTETARACQAYIKNLQEVFK